MKRLYFIFIIYMLFQLMGMSLQAKDPPFQTVRMLLYRFERVDSCMALDMNVDLVQVSLAPDCTVYLYPWLRNGKDSLMLPPVMLNGPQSDRMYRRRKALGKVDKVEMLPPYVVLREGDHPLPCVNYRNTAIPYQSWMDSARIVLHDESYNADSRLLPFRMQLEKVPPVTVIQTRTIILHDTIRISQTVETPVPVVAEKKKEIVTEHAGYCADIYFPAGGMKILPEHELNRTAWRAFVSEIDSLRSGGSNTISGVIVTGYSSPEGSSSVNEHLARKRAEALQQYLKDQYPIQMEVRTEWVAEDWQRLTKMVADSSLPAKERLLSILGDSSLSDDDREQALRQLQGGRPFAQLSQEYFPKLRRVSCRIGYLKTKESIR